MGWSSQEGHFHPGKGPQGPGWSPYWWMHVLGDFNQLYLHDF